MTDNYFVHRERIEELYAGAGYENDRIDIWAGVDVKEPRIRVNGESLDNFLSGEEDNR